MKLTLVATIHYLEKNSLPENEFISIELYEEEGYQLQRALKLDSEGATSLRPHPLLGENHHYDLGNPQFSGLMDEIGKADLAIQFINSFPTVDSDDGEGDGLNLRVIIMHRKTLREALSRFEGHIAPCGVPKVAPSPVLNGFKGIGEPNETALAHA